MGFLLLIGGYIYTVGELGGVGGMTKAVCCQEITLIQAHSLVPRGGKTNKGKLSVCTHNERKGLGLVPPHTPRAPAAEHVFAQPGPEKGEQIRFKGG